MIIKRILPFFLVLMPVLFVFSGACNQKQAAKIDETGNREGDNFKKGMNRLGDKIEKTADEIKKDTYEGPNKKKTDK